MRCPYCGKPLDIGSVDPKDSTCPSTSWLFGFEYRSNSALFGLPLLHVATGINPFTGLPRLARGIIAIGNCALGVFAIGGIAMGVFVLSGIGLGFMVLAGIAVGWIAIGGIAVGAVFALGGLAVSREHAVGALPLALQIVASRYVHSLPAGIATVADDLERDHLQLKRTCRKCQ
ncbi:MAG: hypothetical protein GTO14_24530 [Anaerolineales bacterium]|nr:hypothetical protein [Anaerolineales bacterium]